MWGENNMNIFESRMTGNVYNKADAETWRIVPKFSEAKKTSYLDVNDLVLIDEKVLIDEEGKDPQNIDINGLFDTINKEVM